jgi:hypothetical protein
MYKRTSHAIVTTLISCIALINSVEAADIRLTKSVFGYLADPTTYAKDAYNFGYLPAGTRIEVLNPITGNVPHNKVLARAENGVVTYIVHRKTLELDDLRDLAPGGRFAVIRRAHDHTVKFGDVTFVLGLSRGEMHEVIDDDTDEVTLRVDVGKKLRDAPETPSGTPINFGNVEIKLEVRVPSSVVKIIETASLELTHDFLPVFELAIIDGVAGIEKPCREKKVRVVKTNLHGSVGGRAEVGFSLVKFFADIGFDAERETEEIEVFPETENVKRRYYRRDDYGHYRVTQYKNCNSGHHAFSVVKPNGEEVSLTKDWAKENNLAVDKATGKVLVTCPRQYFSAEEAIVAQGFSDDEAAFVISRTGRWKELSKNGCIEN